MNGTGKLIQFSYIFKDGVIFPCDQVTEFFSDSILIKGVSKRLIYRNGNKKAEVMTGLFVHYEGSEYCSITITADQLRAMMNCVTCSSGSSSSGIFEDVFDTVFE